MDEMQNESIMSQTSNAVDDSSERPAATRRPRTERSRKTKEELFKENTLPLIILGVAGLLILTFIIGSIVRGAQRRKVEAEASIAASESMAAEAAQLSDELNTILSGAEKMAASYDYDGAIALIDSFSGGIGGYPQLMEARTQYEFSKNELIPWDDPNAIENISFHTLVADPERAFSHAEQGSSMKKFYITVQEFKQILEDLYANGYVLVGFKDFVEEVQTGSTITYKYKELLLPEGKKPLVLTQTNLNYNLRLVDSDEDMIADKGGVGIASRLVLDADGSVTCEMVDANGNVTTGTYDLIPILDEFVEQHPDFSYHGSKALLGLTGYQGLFGYRTHPAGRELLGEDVYAENVETVQAIADALKASGYELGCYTYSNAAYGVYSLSEIQADMNHWNDEVVPILGSLDIMIFAQESDISSSMLYSGEKFDYFKSLGFNYFVGFCSNRDPFNFISDNYVRMGRKLVMNDYLVFYSDWFKDLFTVEGLLGEVRNG